MVPLHKPGPVRIFETQTDSAGKPMSFATLSSCVQIKFGTTEARNLNAKCPHLFLPNFLPRSDEHVQDVKSHRQFRGYGTPRPQGLLSKGRPAHVNAPPTNLVPVTTFETQTDSAGTPMSFAAFFSCVERQFDTLEA